MEVFAGSYKDGTEENNKRDYRYFVGFYLMARLVNAAIWHANGPLAQQYCGLS